MAGTTFALCDQPGRPRHCNDARKPALCRGIAKIIRLIRQQELALGRRISYAVPLMRTAAAILPWTFEQLLTRNSVPALDSQMHAPEAFPAIFSFGGSLQAHASDHY